jgi:ribosomal protein S9
MAFSAATAQATVEAAREALIKATQQIELYIQVNSPGLLAQTDAALTAAKTAITAVQA